MIIQLCVAYCIVFPPYDFTLVLESDCTFEQVLQPSPGDPVCSDIFNCRRSLIKISLTVFTSFFYKYRTVRLNLLSVPMLLIILIFIPCCLALEEGTYAKGSPLYSTTKEPLAYTERITQDKICK
jgi:hypothetical protein